MAGMVCGVLGFCIPFLPAILGLILAILGLRDIGQSRGRLTGHGLAIAGIVLSAVSGLLWLIAGPILLIALLVPGIGRIREAAVRVASGNNLKSIGLAMHNYHDTYNTLPPAALSGKDGRPLLSWRVLILPYLADPEAEALYKEFHLDEPWDSAHNKPLLARMPKVYRSSDQGARTDVTETHYRVFVGRVGQEPRTVFVERGRSASLPQIMNADGTHDTILVVEAAETVPWTKPYELLYVPVGPPVGSLPRLGGITSTGYNVLFADGSVRFFPKGLDEHTLRLMITFNDGMAIPPEAGE
jgi:prepilin-type processing-associated H-X9-DG protein